jgi:peptide-methionine (S)-S-oxide reductase
MGCSHSTPSTTATKEHPQRKAVPAGPAPEASDNISNKVALGAGCYWGTEKYVRIGTFFEMTQALCMFHQRFSILTFLCLTTDFQKKFPGAIKEATVGFMSPEDKPRIKSPNYKQVCTGQSGHVEVLYVELNDPKKHFEELCRFFFTFHDPTLINRQGHDRGFQYSSSIFCDDDEQFEIAKKVKEELQGALDLGVVKAFESRKVETQIFPLKEFTAAEAEHQEYLFKNPKGYCNHRIRMKEWYELK